MSTTEEVNGESNRPQAELIHNETEKVLSCLEEAYEIFHREIEQKIESAGPYLEAEEGQVLDCLYENDMSHDEVAELMGITVVEVCKLRASGIRKVADHIGPSISEMETLLRLYSIIHKGCSPEIIDQLRAQFNT